MSFAEILDAVDSLPLNQQIRILETLKSRIIENKRNKIYQEYQESLGEFESGFYKEENAGELINRLSGN